MLIGIVWRRAWFYCFIITQPLVLQMKHVSLLKYIYKWIIVKRCCFMYYHFIWRWTKYSTPEVYGVWNFRLRSCFGGIHSNTFQNFELRLLFKLQSVCCKLLAASKRPYPVFTLKRLKKRIKRNCWALQNMWPMGRLRLWILTFENLFIRHLYCNSTAWRECSGLGINEVNVKEKP